MKEVDDRPMADFTHCNKPGHKDGCPCGAGGDAELRPLTTDEKWDLALDIVVYLPEGDREAAQKIVDDNGLQAEYISNDNGDRLLLRLWRGDNDDLHTTLDIFYIEVSGYDAMHMAIFDLAMDGEIHEG